MDTKIVVSEKLTEQQARDKNLDEYNPAGTACYNGYAQGNNIQNNYCYYSTVKEIELENGIEGKTFLEVGCGPCPLGQRLAKKGAKKIYGLDISPEMIEDTRKILTA